MTPPSPASAQLTNVGVLALPLWKYECLVPQSGDSGLFIEQEGVREVFQLDGGALKYFEACGVHTIAATVSCSISGGAVNLQLEETVTTTPASLAEREDAITAVREPAAAFPRNYTSVYL
jgi:hypothetical protein